MKTYEGGQREMREAAALACEAEDDQGSVNQRLIQRRIAKSIRALPIAEQPAQEPVAFVHWPLGGTPCLVWHSNKALENALRGVSNGGQPDQMLYAAPPDLAAEVERLTAELAAANHSTQVAYENFAVMTDQRDTLMLQRDQLLSAIGEVIREAFNYRRRAPKRGMEKVSAMLRAALAAIEKGGK